MNIKFVISLLTTTLLLSGWNPPYAGTQPQFANTELLVHTRTAQLAQHCLNKWQQSQIKFSDSAFAKPSNFEQGVQRLCQARAELFFAGYAIEPTLKPSEQSRNYHLLFLPSVAAMKQQIQLVISAEHLI